MSRILNVHMHTPQPHNSRCTTYRRSRTPKDHSSMSSFSGSQVCPALPPLHILALYLLRGGRHLKAPRDTHPNQEIFMASQRGLLGFVKSTKSAFAVHGIRTATVQSTTLPGKRYTRTNPVSRGEPHTDLTLCATGHGDTDLTFTKTGHAMFFCATNPDPDANGSVWASLHNGIIQRVEEAQRMGSLGSPPEYTQL